VPLTVVVPALTAAIVIVPLAICSKLICVPIAKLNVASVGILTVNVPLS
jgi:hypothetical protein